MTLTQNIIMLLLTIIKTSIVAITPIRGTNGCNQRELFRDILPCGHLHVLHSTIAHMVGHHRYCLINTLKEKVFCIVKYVNYLEISITTDNCCHRKLLPQSTVATVNCCHSQLLPQSTVATDNCCHRQLLPQSTVATELLPLTTVATDNCCHRQLLPLTLLTTVATDSCCQANTYFGTHTNHISLIRCWQSNSGLVSQISCYAHRQNLCK